MKMFLLLLAPVLAIAVAYHGAGVVSRSPVLSYSIPGNMVTQGGTHPVVLSVFIRIVCDSPHAYRVRAFAFATSVSHTYTSWFGGIFSMPPDAVAWTPRLQLRETFSGRVFDLELRPHQAFSEESRDGEPRVVMPYAFSGSFETAADALEVHVDDWDRFVHLPVGPSATLEAPSDTYTVVLPPIHGLSAESAANIVSVNANYHAKLGLKVMAYVAVPYMQAYTTNRCIAQLQAQNLLTLVVWDDIPESKAHTYGHKPLCYSHALLSRWGSLETLLMIDVDEFLAIPQATDNVGQHIRSCLCSNPGSIVLRCDTVMMTETTEPDRHSWNVSRTCGIDFMKDYGTIAAYHIVQAGKSFVNSSDTLAYAVHSGHVMAGENYVVEWDCLRILHIVNLMRHRIDFDASMQQMED